jgi:membrane fusion protein, peptide pheromone/bacteriocin exporter
MLTSDNKISNTTISYLPRLSKSSYALYWTILLLVVASLVSLPLIRTTIAVGAQGITRPSEERTEVKLVIGGIIDTIYYHEGDSVKKGATLLRIKDMVSPGKRILNNFQINQHGQFIHDLKLLTSGEPNEALISRLVSPVYREQLSHYLHQKSDQDATLKKATKELNMNTALVKGRAITQKEFFDTQVQFDKANGSYKAFLVEQQSNWQQDMARYNLELSQYKQELGQINADASYYEVKAPVSGTLQGINNRYAGGILQPNETLCTISPNGNLLGECYILPKDIGLIKVGQKARFQIGAFNYNYFGVLTGKVIAIDNDFTTINNNPLFKVRCRFDNMQLHLKNGFAGNLQKGLTFQVRFIIGERTLWQLLWDKIDDWLNPSAPQ